MQTWTFDSLGPDEMRERGAALGRAIGADGLAIALIGPLGAGKTVFVKGLAEGLGVDPRLVSSPTFVIAQQYPIPEGPSTLYHIDLYRLESEDELESIGFYDMLAPGSVLAVEWADRFPGLLGRECLTIELEGPSAVESESSDLDERAAAANPRRRARVMARGEDAERVLCDFAERVDRERQGAPGGGLCGETESPETERAAETRAETHASRGVGVVSSPEMRVLFVLWLAFALFYGGRILAGPADRDPGHVDCGPDAGWVAVAEDSLGTLRMACARSSDAELTGVGRLLRGDRIDVNRASASLLETLPGIGPVRARAIVRAREEAPFVSARDLERVPGIGARTRHKLERWVMATDVGAAAFD